MLRIKLVTKFENEEKLMSVLKSFIKCSNIIPIVGCIKEGSKYIYNFKININDKNKLKTILKNIGVNEFYIASIEL